MHAGLPTILSKTVRLTECCVEKMYSDGFSAEKQTNYRYTSFVSKMLAGLSVWNWVVLGGSCIKLAEAEVLSLITHSAIVGNIYFWTDTKSVLSSSTSIHRFNVICIVFGMVQSCF
jgi:hypothetical protein